VANGRGDQRRYTSGHGDGSGDRYGCEEPLMITDRAVSALLLHHCRRVVVRRAVNYDFAGALPPTQILAPGWCSALIVNTPPGPITTWSMSEPRSPTRTA